MIVMHGQSTRHAYHNKQKISSIPRAELLEGRPYTWKFQVSSLKNPLKVRLKIKVMFARSQQSLRQLQSTHRRRKMVSTRSILFCLNLYSNYAKSPKRKQCLRVRREVQWERSKCISLKRRQVPKHGAACHSRRWSSWCFRIWQLCVVADAEQTAAGPPKRPRA